VFRYFCTGTECENKIIAWLIREARRGFPITKPCLLFSVNKIVEQCYDKEELPFADTGPGKKWYASFKKLHPVISEKRSEYLGESRAKVTEQRIRKWFKAVVKDLEETNNTDILQDPKRIYNLDETCFFLNSNGKVVLSEKGHPVYDINSNSDRDNVTVLYCMNAAGEFAPPLVVYKYLRLPGHFRDSLPENWSIKGTKSGWMNQETFYEYIANVFIPYIREQHGEAPVVLFFDGHKSHLSLPLSDIAYENNLHLICLLANSTQILQPWDVGGFKGLKTKWKIERPLYELEKKTKYFEKRSADRSPTNYG